MRPGIGASAPVKRPSQRSFYMRAPSSPLCLNPENSASSLSLDCGSAYRTELPCSLLKAHHVLSSSTHQTTVQKIALTFPQVLHYYNLLPNVDERFSIRDESVGMPRRGVRRYLVVRAASPVARSANAPYPESASVSFSTSSLSSHAVSASWSQSSSASSVSSVGSTTPRTSSLPVTTSAIRRVRYSRRSSISR